MNNALITFNDEQIALIRSQIAPNANENELKLFLHQAKRTGLDPLTRQIYCIHRNTKDVNGNTVKRMTIQTSIDGFRVIAERSGDYAGQDEPVFTETDGKLISCKITVYRFRGEQRYPAAVGVAYMSEYNAGGPMWTKMPHTMLAKCAEALALRKAYPQDLSGLYTADEMQQAEEEVDEVGNDKREYLERLLESSTYDERIRTQLRYKIGNIKSYFEYSKAKENLLDNQLGIDGQPNYTQTDAAKAITKRVKMPADDKGTN